jgi:hypothetical protein
MSNVTQSGPKGYEYQYVVSLLIALQQIDLEQPKNNIELYIEAVGIEDAFLRINSNGNVQNIEIQVKSEQNQLTIKTLTEWLYHFEARGSNENLLKKVIDGSIALFVTQSRCSDNVYQFKKNLPNFFPHENLSISKKSKWTNEFLENLKQNEFSKKTTNLAIQRNQLIQNQILYFSTNQTFNNTFKNVIIWEEVSHQKLDYEIELLLNQKFKIPQSQNANIRRELYEKIIVGRDTQQDVIPSIRKILQENQPRRPQLNKQHQYITRVEEQELIEKLENDNLLLLTGRSFCGKSELSKKIATHFFDKGFSYKNWDDVQALREFFSQNAKEDKIAILEDPWGHIKAKEESVDIKRRIELLASNLPNNHKLIITSRIEILSEAFENQTSIKDQSWIDLSIDKNEELIKYWNNFIAQTELSKSVAELVVQNINKTNSTHALQIGELEYLSRQENLDGKTFEELIHIARRDLRDIANNLIKEKVVIKM